MTTTCIYKGKTLENCAYPIDGTQVKYKCIPFYEDLALAQFPFRICIEGTWNYPAPNCLPSTKVCF